MIAIEESIADWELWDTKDYLNTYFSIGQLGADSFEAWKFLIRELHKLPKKPETILDFGCGPTLFASIPCVPFCEKLHLADYLDTNTNAIGNWVENMQDAFDWSYCIGEVLKLEGIDPTEENILLRENRLRSMIERIEKCDAGKSQPLEYPKKYEVVVSTYCVDSATPSKDIWHIYMKNLLSVLDDSGILLLTALRNCSSYKVGEYLFPSADIDEKDLIDAFGQNGFSKNQYEIEVVDAPSCEDEGFTGLLFAKLIK